MDTSKLKELIELMNRYQLEELSVEEGSFKAHLKKRDDRVKEVIAVPNALPGAPLAAPVAAAGAPAAAPADEANHITSPLVGTFYQSPSPDADAFVEVGDRVEEGQVLCIVEAMKVMNEVKADRSGVLQEVLVENGAAVEYGTPLFRIA